MHSTPHYSYPYAIRPNPRLFATASGIGETNVRCDGISLYINDDNILTRVYRYSLTHMRNDSSTASTYPPGPRVGQCRESSGACRVQQMTAKCPVADRETCRTIDRPRVRCFLGCVRSWSTAYEYGMMCCAKRNPRVRIPTGHERSPSVRPQR